mmetsp:Transcript_3592/g.13162  ORF Transcript_3592/g.13162 Transcript_3592/m.13162 type:complete len:246 (-) Transcript_3592:646-1383(-)
MGLLTTFVFCHSPTRASFKKITDPVTKLPRARSPQRVKSTQQLSPSPDGSHKPISRLVISRPLDFALKVIGSFVAYMTALMSRRVLMLSCSRSRRGLKSYVTPEIVLSSSTASIIADSSKVSVKAPLSNLGLAAFTKPRWKMNTWFGFSIWKNMSTAFPKNVAEISPDSSLISTLKSCPSPRAFVNLRMSDLAMIRALMRHRLPLYAESSRMGMKPACAAACAPPPTRAVARPTAVAPPVPRVRR